MDTNEQNGKINGKEKRCDWYNIQYVSNGFHNQINTLGGLNISRLQITGQDARGRYRWKHSNSVNPGIYRTVLKVNMQIQSFQTCQQYIIQFTFLHKTQ
jgi:hypothetical protein